MKLNYKELCTIYQTIVNEMANTKRDTPPDYVGTLMDIEIKLSKHLKKIQNETKRNWL